MEAGSVVRVAQGDLCHRLHTSFAGVPTAQFWCDFYLWELILNDRPDLRGIVEIGTWQGGFSRYLSHQAYLRSMSFITFDAVQPKIAPPRFRKADVFDDRCVVTDPMRWWTPVALLCDGGNKPRELEMFGPRVGEGGIAVVHDWGYEIGPEDVPDTMREVYGDVCDELGSLSRVFEVAA